MRREILFSLTAVLFLCSAALPQAGKTSLYPPIEPHETGFLKVSHLHSLYWMVSGNNDGIPVIALHGGPGGRSSSSIRRLFDPNRYRIIQFDQRGAGKSTPAAEWRENTTQLLIEDINKLRDHLKVDGKAVLFGISWGTTLALAYAEKYPEKVAGLVLTGVFTARRQEIDHLYRNGAAMFYPDNLEKLREVLPRPEKNDYARQLFEVITGDNRQLAERAIIAFGAYETWMESVGATYEKALEDAKEPKTRALATLENFYMMNQCFLKEGQLLAQADRITNIPTYIANGRLDMLTPSTTAFELSKRLKRVRLDIVEGSGHGDLGVALGAVRGGNWILEQIGR